MIGHRRAAYTHAPFALLITSLFAAGCTTPRAASVTPRTDSAFLYVWTQTADTTRPAAFMTVFDLRDGSPTAGQIVNTVWAGKGSSSVHHTEASVQRDQLLFANDFGKGRTYVFDVGNPGVPRIAATFGTAGPFGWPHSYSRLPNGTRLVTYQWDSTRFDKPPGGIAEVTTTGKIVRWARASSPDADDKDITPYSVEVIPSMDRAVTTSTSMIEDTGVHIQIWRLSDLTLLHTLRIPAPPHAMHATDTVAHHLLPAEPRLLTDGRTVMFGTFMCGLFTLTDIESSHPRIAMVSTFPGENCAVPVTMGKYWIQTVPSIHGVVALDISNPAAPREVSRLTFDDSVKPHWLARNETGTRLVMNSGSKKDPNVYLMTFDPATGKLGHDERFAALSVARVSVPGIGDVPGEPHGTVFSR